MRHPLIFYKEYHCWREGQYIGIATYTDDNNIGPSFLVTVVMPSGELVNEVLIPDQWEFKQTE